MPIDIFQRVNRCVHAEEMLPSDFRAQFREIGVHCVPVHDNCGTVRVERV